MTTPGIHKNRRDSDEIRSYREAARRHPPLARKEEHALALRARRGDLNARDTLVRHNLAFVIAIASKQRRGALPLDDLVQEGSLGLLRAVEKFDPHAGTRFLTYAGWWIRAYIGRYLKESRSTVRPRSGTVAQPDVSLESPLGDEEGTSHLDLIEAEEPSPEDACLSADTDRRVRHALGRVRRHVGEVGWDIIQHRLEQDPPRTLFEIGQRWSLSRERIRQIEVRTKHVLQRHLEATEADLARDAA